MNSRTYCFDLDGTLCTNTEGSYEDARPMFDRIKLVNNLFETGNTIIIFTARGSTTGIDWSSITSAQLKAWNVKYHNLIMGKPFADIYIDDKCVSDFDFFKSEND